MFADEWATFPSRYAGHLSLSASAILTGLLVSVPLGVLASRSDRFGGPILGAASVVQTIPGLALLALMVPLLGGRIGFWPAYTALSLYSVLPVLRNTIVGLRGVDADVREAALGVGMTAAQRLREVDLPLAAPVIVAGLRTASVWVVGAATLSTPVGAESLGNYIFQGLQTRNWGAVLFGCLVSAALALALDQVIAQFETAAQNRSRRRAAVGAAGLALIALPTLFNLSAPAPATGEGFRAGTEGAAQTLEGRTIRIGAKAFTEQYILADVLKRRLEAEGARVEVRDGLGSTVAFDAAARGEIDISIDYTGTVWATILKRDDPVPRAVMFAETSAHLLREYDVLAFARLGFENAYALAVSQETAAARGLVAVQDLSGERLTIASDPEFFGRPEWARVREAYGLASLRTRGMDSTFMYEAARSGEVDVITAYTTDGRIDAYDLVLLDEPAGALPPYDAFLILSPEAAANRALLEALEPLRGAISQELMRAANGKVDLDRDSVAEAGAWLYSQLADE